MTLTVKATPKLTSKITISNVCTLAELNPGKLCLIENELKIF